MTASGAVTQRLVRGGAGCMMLIEVRDHAAGS